MEGNKRFVLGNQRHPNQNIQRRKDLEKGQNPFAVVLTCSDSRTCPEIIFDQGLGDIFVVRTAGNVLDDVSLGSIEYAADHLNVPLIVVLGHTNCGAVNAALSDQKIENHCSHIVEKIKPAFKNTKDPDEASLENVKNITNQLNQSEPVLKGLVESNELEIVGAFYDLKSGTVKVIF